LPAPSPTRRRIAAHNFSDEAAPVQTEGQICKLKLAKRQMYGCGNLDPLQARVIGLR
jgi:hypothetical protein